MYLTSEENKMLEGKFGYPVKKAMEILVQLGKIYNAEKMIPISSVHMPGSSVVVAGEAGTKFVEKMLENKGTFSVMTTLNTAALDFTCWEQIGFSIDTKKLQERLTSAYEKMGALPCHTCTPYLIGNIPRYGEHVAWGESSAIAFVNSVIGARTNREGGPSALAAALTGRVPAYGYHLEENRYGNILVEVDTELQAIDDFGSLGYFVGKVCGSKVPVFTGIKSGVSTDNLKMLSAALASSGAVALFHIVGVTPEAPTLEDAFGSNRPELTLSFSQEQLRESRKLLNKHNNQNVSLVAIGCPHASIQEIEQVAREIQNKQLYPGVELWIITSQPNKAYAERCGFRQIIENAGGRIVTDTCPILSPMADLAQKKGYSAMATNSAKLAHYAPGQWSMPTYYGSLKQCIDAAVTGRFEE